MNKRGIFFTLTAIFLLGLMLFIILAQQERRDSDDVAALTIKIRAMNEFVKSVDEDLERGLFITGFRAFLGIQQHIATQGSYLADTESQFREALVNGTVLSAHLDIMNDSTFVNWTTRIAGEAGQLGLDVNFTVDQIDIYHSEPWIVSVDATVTMNVTDSSQTAFWVQQRTIQTNISVDGLEDPLYLVETGGVITRVINRTIYEGAYVQDADTSNLTLQVAGKYYTNSTGPSYLMRLEGNLSNSTNNMGIEGFVFIPDLIDQGITTFERSSVDYIYYGNDSPTLYTINETFESWFRLDGNHLTPYQAQNSTI